MGMREIKFRAWDKESKIMIYNFQNVYDGDCGFNSVNPNGDISIYDCKGVDIDSFGSNLDNEDVVIMQFTGLKDKNGKEIYEGDIVKIPGGIATIKWIDYLGWDSGGSGHPGFYPVIKGYEEKEKDGIHVEMEYTVSFYDCEIIGNIYENGELLE